MEAGAGFVAAGVRPVHQIVQVPYYGEVRPYLEGVRVDEAVVAAVVVVVLASLAEGDPYRDQADARGLEEGLEIVERISEAGAGVEAD